MILVHSYIQTFMTSLVILAGACTCMTVVLSKFLTLPDRLPSGLLPSLQRQHRHSIWRQHLGTLYHYGATHSYRWCQCYSSQVLQASDMVWLAAVYGLDRKFYISGC
jgi:hypothetical protein